MFVVYIYIDIYIYVYIMPTYCSVASIEMPGRHMSYIGWEDGCADSVGFWLWDNMNERVVIIYNTGCQVE